MRFRTQIAKKDKYSKGTHSILALGVAFVLLLCAGSAEARRHHAPGCNTHKCDVWAGRQWVKHNPFTGFVVRGKISVFGGELTADGGSTNRPCIALRSSSTKDHIFLVKVDYNGHEAKMIQCDWGPAAWTGRSIDITEVGAATLGLSVSGFPTDTMGTAREMR